jgi:pilus assembly protein CpaB
MNRTRLLFIGILALALGGLLSSVVYQTLKKATGQPVQGEEIAVAANDIQVGAKIGENDVKMVKFPSGDLPAGVFHYKKNVVGRGVTLPITKGEFIISNKVVDPNMGGGLPILIPRGMRAVSVRVNEVVGVAGFVVPGTRVDVLLTGNPAGTNQPLTTTVLQNVEVLAAGQRLERSAAGDPQTASVVTLAVLPEDAQRLTLASVEGKIQLSLRNPADTNQEKPSSVRMDAVYGSAGPPPATAAAPKTVVRHTAAKPSAPPAPNVYTIEVYKGNKKEDTKFDGGGQK